MGGLKLGHDFDSTAMAHMAVELEAFYGGVDGRTRSRSGAFELRNSGDITAATFMVNALVKFNPGWRGA